MRRTAVIDRSVLPARRLFGLELRRYRECRGMTLEQLAASVLSSRSQLSRIEMAQMLAPYELPKMLDSVLSTDGIFCKLYEIVKFESQSHPDRYRRREEMEARSKRIDCYAAQVVPDFLQSEGYARALFRIGHPNATEDDLDGLVRVLAGRQALLIGEQAVLRSDAAPRISVILDEAVVRRPIGTPDVMHAQVLHLAKNVHTSSCVVQLLPFERGAHALLSGAVNLLALSDGSFVEYRDEIGGGRASCDAESAATRSRYCDLLRAYALSPTETASFLYEIAEGLAREGHLPDYCRYASVAQSRSMRTA